MGKIAIIKESNLVWEGIIRIIENKLPDHIISVFESDQHQIVLKDNNKYDLIIVDSEVDLLQFISSHSKNVVNIAAFASKVEVNYITELFKLGLKGYLSNEMSTKELVIAIKNMLNGMQYICSHLATVLLQDYIRLVGTDEIRPNGILTEREWDVLELIVKGQSNNGIASNLFISAKTVHIHVASILRKLNVPDRTNAALLAIKEKWVVL